MCCSPLETLQDVPIAGSGWAVFGEQVRLPYESVVCTRPVDFGVVSHAM